ncbi:MAG TPA: hypothetical protein VFW96_23835 [Thermomicrobiales bacterium]|nr:hypothetical protein [Thermomicrobiales bacterium]
MSGEPEAWPSEAFAAEDTAEPPRAVLDTSSLFPPTSRRELHFAAVSGAFEAIWSPWIIAELNRVLVWDWIARTGDDLSRRNQARCAASAHRMMEILLPVFTLINPLPPYPPAWPTLPDTWDHPVWAAAKVSGARYVISENTRHFPPPDADGRRRHEGIEYLTARAFLAALRRGPDSAPVER